MGRSKRSKIFFGTLIKCRNNELLRKFSFLKITTKETTMHIQAYTLHNMTNKSNSTITYYYKDILYSRKQRQKNLGLHRYLADWKLDSSKNKIRVSDFFHWNAFFLIFLLKTAFSPRNQLTYLRAIFHGLIIHIFGNQANSIFIHATNLVYFVSSVSVI